MNFEEIFKEIEVFSSATHGSSDYDSEEYFLQGAQERQFAPLAYLVKKIPALKDVSVLFANGLIYDSFDFIGNGQFVEWYESQFGKKLTKRVSRKIYIIHMPNNRAIIDSLSEIHKAYEVLRTNQIILNGKNFPTQLGEWYARCIFALKQIKSTSQRGFDFLLEDKRVEVNVSWSDVSSPKGVKIKKTLVDLSDYCIIIYMGNNFMIREICFLDSEFVSRKFAGKGDTIFLKDGEVSSYFFSKASRHLDKVVNSSALLKFSSPTLAMKLAEKF